jgi:hypothetical protein
VIPLWLAIGAFVIAGTGLHVGLHYAAHGVVNVHQAALAFFLVINVLVNLWEFTLHKYAARITREWEETQLPYKGREAERANAFFQERATPRELFTLRRWTGLWSSYALFDRGYADIRSFGWNIDVGNGWSTIVPALLTAWGMTYEIVPARALGIVGVAMYWQMLYGTLVYFFQFFNNRNHVGISSGALWAFVGGTNGFWFVFPIWGIAVSVALIYADSFAILR